MNFLERRHTLDEKHAFTSLWAIPDGYCRQAAVILAHGAGSDKHHPFISFIHERLAERGFLSIKFNFPYKEQGRKAPDRMPVLMAAWRKIISAVRDDPELSPGKLFLSGKSMGGRVASLLVAEGESCEGLVFLGYPLHPPGKPEKLRAGHFGSIQCPMLFIQGDRDRLCELELLRAQLDRLKVPVTLYVIEGGDHSFKVLKRLGRSEEEVWAEIAGVMTSWIEDHLAKRSGGSPLR